MKHLTVVDIRCICGESIEIRLESDFVLWENAIQHAMIENIRQTFGYDHGIGDSIIRDGKPHKALITLLRGDIYLAPHPSDEKAKLAT